MPQWMKTIGAGLTTIFVFAILVWSLWYVFFYMNAAPSLDKDGKVVLDKFGNAKGILLVILPLATSAVGFWLGNQGTAAAKADAKDAVAQKEAVISAANTATPGQDVLAVAKTLHPEAFGLDKINGIRPTSVA